MSSVALATDQMIVLISYLACPVAASGYEPPPLTIRDFMTWAVRTVFLVQSSIWWAIRGERLSRVFPARMEIFWGCANGNWLIKLVECQSICIMRFANLIEVFGRCPNETEKGDNLFVFKNECRDVTGLSEPKNFESQNSELIRFSTFFWVSNISIPDTVIVKFEQFL